MGSIKSTENTKNKNKREHHYIPHQLRSRPFRCITLPMVCLTVFIFYWFVLVPLVYNALGKKCAVNNCNWGTNWQHIYWAVVSAIFLILLVIALCLWCLKQNDEKSEGVTQKLIQNDEERHNDLKNNVTFYNVENEKKSISRETIENDNFNVASLQHLENNTEKTTVTLPTKKTIITEEVIMKETKEVKKVEKKPIRKDVKQKTNDDETLLEEIDKMFPRCSMRRKPDQKKRPDTLIIHSPKYPKQDLNRHSMTERPKSASPLTPREIFFFDLIQSANRQTLDRTNNFLENERHHSSNNYTKLQKAEDAVLKRRSETDNAAPEIVKPKTLHGTKNFLENERKHSSNNFVNLRKPEVKDFVLKQRSETEASSPEIFIANVPPQRNSCTAEVFMFVDGGQPEEVLTICHIEQDDDVFKN